MKSQVLLVQHDWTPPYELERSRPREVLLTRSGKALVVGSILLLAGALAAGVALGVAASRDAREAGLLNREGVIADGVVTRVWRGRDEHRQPWIAYRFEADDRIYGQNAKVPLSMWRNLQAGSHLAVRYAPSRPDLNHPVNLRFRTIPIWVPFMVAFWIGIWSPVMLLPIRRQRKLLAEGRPALGIISRHSALIRGSHGEKQGMKFFYDFSLLSGAQANGSFGPVKAPPAVGAKITVLYDPEKPRRNTPYPFTCPLVRPR